MAEQMTMTTRLARCAAVARTGAAALAGGVVAVAGPALAQDTAPVTGQPVEYQLDLQPAATDIMEQAIAFHDLLLVIITAITLFVLALLIYVCLRYNERANPTPSRVTHNSLLEVAWTVVPVVILLVIAVPSFKLLYAQHEFPKPDLTIKATGYQWYWGYEYPKQAGLPEGVDELIFDALMLQDDELKPGQPRLLATDNEVVVPVGAVVHVLVTAGDVMHNWTVPSFGSKIDAVPGRLNSTWFQAREEGVYYGQCSELCGKLHAFMPIAVRVVDQETFAEWAAAMADDEDAAREVISASIEAKAAKKVAQVSAQ